MPTVLDHAEWRARALPIFEQSPLFHGLSAEQQAQAYEHAQVVRFEDAEALTLQGEGSDRFFLMIEGTASVFLDQSSGQQPFMLARLEPPESVGEVGVLLETPRSASVVAVNAVLALEFTSEAFHEMLLEMPYFGLVMCRTLATRLRRANRRLPVPEASEEERPSPELVRLLPAGLLLRHRVLPLELQGTTLVVGCVDEPETPAINAIREKLPGLTLRTVRISNGLFNEVLRGVGGVGGNEAEPTPRDTTQLDALLRRALEEGASDLHLAARHCPRWRIQGEVLPLDDLEPLGPEEVLELVAPLMSDHDREIFEARQDVDFAYELAEGRFRVHVYREARGLSAVFRPIPSQRLTVAQLGLPASVEPLTRLREGLIVVYGPARSGKSTTLAAIVDAINRRRAVHILTIEEPVEFAHQSARALVNQRSVGPHAPSFAAALRAATREDPDVIMVSSLPDAECVGLAIDAARRGHLVLASVEARSAVQAIEQLLDGAPESAARRRDQLADCLRAALGQMLLPRAQSVGRVPACELLLADEGVATLIRAGDTKRLRDAMSRGDGDSQLFDEDLARLVATSAVELEEALRVAHAPADLERRIQSGP